MRKPTNSSTPITRIESVFSGVSMNDYERKISGALGLHYPHLWPEVSPAPPCASIFVCLRAHILANTRTHPFCCTHSLSLSLTHTHTQTHTHTLSRSLSLPHTYTHTHTHTYTHTHTQTHSLSHIYMDFNTQTRTRIHTHMHTHKRAWPLTRTCIHSPAHAYILSLSAFLFLSPCSFSL